TGVKDRVAHALPVSQLHELLRIGPGTPEVLQTWVEGHPTQRIPVQILYMVEVASRDDAPVVDEEPGAQVVTTEQRDQVLQGARVMHIAVEDLVEQGKALRLGHAQADLDEGAALNLFLVVARFAQGTVAA